jgi:hypothetical protein
VELKCRDTEVDETGGNFTTVFVNALLKRRGKRVLAGHEVDWDGDYAKE